MYRHDPATGETSVVADGFDKPNGIALSPDQSVLYVTDTGANQEPGRCDGEAAHGGAVALITILLVVARAVNVLD